VGEASAFGAAKPTVNTILTLEPRSGGRITPVGATHGIPPEGLHIIAKRHRAERGIMLNRTQAPGVARSVR